MKNRVSVDFLASMQIDDAINKTQFQSTTQKLVDRLGVAEVQSLLKVLWRDEYINPKTGKSIRSRALHPQYIDNTRVGLRLVHQMRSSAELAIYIKRFGLTEVDCQELKDSIIHKDRQTIAAEAKAYSKMGPKIDIYEPKKINFHFHTMPMWYVAGLTYAHYAINKMSDCPSHIVDLYNFLSGLEEGNTCLAFWSGVRKCTTFVLNEKIGVADRMETAKNLRLVAEDRMGWTIEGDTEKLPDYTKDIVNPPLVDSPKSKKSQSPATGTDISGDGKIQEVSDGR